MNLKSLIFLFAVLLGEVLYSQVQSTFRGYAQAGFNTSQIDGDSTAGFNYWGLRAGGGAYFMVTKRFSVNLEMNYTMRGASGEVFDQLNQYLSHQAIRTNYIEMPLIFNYHDGNIARFGLGVCVSSLLSSSYWYNKKRVDTEAVKNLYKSMDIGVVASVTFDIQKHFGANIRMNRSIIPMNNPRPGEGNQYHINLSANGIYYF